MCVDYVISSLYKYMEKRIWLKHEYLGNNNIVFKINFHEAYVEVKPARDIFGK